MPRPASPRKGSPVRPAPARPRSSRAPKKAAARGQARVEVEWRRRPRHRQAAGARRPAGPERRASEKIVHAGRTVPGAPTPSAAPAAASTSTASSSRATRCASGRSGSARTRRTSTPCTTRTWRRWSSDAPLEVLDSTRENVLAHERVNETVMREHTVIPMSFGTIFKTREDIVELLRSAAEAFGDVLNKMQNKLEFGLKVLWDRDQAIREVEHEDEDISRLKKEISGQKGPTYFARMQHGRLIDSALQARSERYVADILEQLREVSVASRINKPIGDKMIMNAAFLIARDQETAFDSKVKSIASRFDKLTFRFTGPWPPYNFVNIRLKLERV